MQQPDEATAEHLFERAEMRMLGDGVPAPDLKELRARVNGFSQWFDAWADVAERYEDAAEAAHVRGHTRTAGQLWWQASLSWQYAQFMWFHEPDRQRSGQERKVRAYELAAPLLDPPAARMAISFGRHELPAYLRQPQRGTGPFPCAILIGGMESTKEESLRFEDLLLTRGVATLAFDGPGQGEFAASSPLDGSFDEATSAVVDALLQVDAIDGDRIGVLGRSLGGFLAPLSAARDPRLRACAAFGALFDLRFWEDLGPVPASGFRKLTGLPEADEAEAALHDAINLAPVIDQIECPLLVVHGELDPLIPVEQAHLTIAGAVNAPVTPMIVPGGDHCGHNQHHLVRPQIADWLADNLGAGEHVD